MRKSLQKLLIRQLSAGTTPWLWLEEWTLLIISILLFGAGSALFLASYFVPQITKSEAAVQQNQLEEVAQEFLDGASIPLDIRNPFPNDPEFSKFKNSYWEERWFRIPRVLRNVGLALLGVSGVCGIAALLHRSGRTRTVGYLRLLDRITEGHEDVTALQRSQLNDSDRSHA